MAAMHANTAVEHQLTERRTERQSAVHRDRPVADGLAAPVRRGKVGDHRPGADEEGRLPESGEHARNEERKQRGCDEVARDRHCDRDRTSEHQHASTESITETSDARSEEHGPDREGADRNADLGVVAAEPILHVQRQHGEQHAEREEVGETTAGHE